MSRIDDRLAKAGDEWRAQVDADCAHRRWRSPERRRRLGVLAAAAVVTAVVVVGIGIVVVRDHDGSRPGPGPDQADCAAPVLKVAGPGVAGHLVRNGAVTITGRYYVTGCQDGEGDPTPLPAVSVVLVSAGGQRASLGKGEPSGELGTFTIRAIVPSDFAAGPAVVRDGGIARDVAVTIG